jgi:high-affinity nickel-transport protein
MKEKIAAERLASRVSVINVTRRKRLMPASLMNLFSDEGGGLRGKVIGIYALLLAFNAGAWIWAFIDFHNHPVLLGTAALAYSFGLRHAVDADHIAAIDNVIRKMMQEGKRPVTAGFMFSLGHSTFVFLGSAAIAGIALQLEHRVAAIKSAGAVIGSLISAGFLFAIAIANMAVLWSVHRAYSNVRRGEPYAEDDFEMFLSSRGFLSRLFRSLFGMIRRSWHMYPLGILFGLGFDTTTEIGLLGISAAAASRGLKFSSILVFPALFAAGMSLIDTTDNVLMLGAYGWALAKPIRKLYYNLTITWISVIVAMAVGGIEVLGVLKGHFQWEGRIWGLVTRLNDNLATLGYAILAVFVVSWAAAFALYKWRGLDELELNSREPESDSRG